MNKFLRILFVTGLIISSAIKLNAQGEVGIYTTTPAEKLDINGALVVSGTAVMATPVPGTIRYTASTGFHDGYLSAGYWREIENFNKYYQNGDYTALQCGDTSTVNIGAITGTSTGANETPFATQYSDKRAQYLYKASELLAWGLCAGNITKVGWNVISIGSPGAINGFYIKMKLTSSTDLTGTVWETGVTTVYGPASFSIASGLNTFTLTTPFYWDGATNVLVEICYDNASGVSNTSVDWTSPLSFNGTRYALATTGSGCALSAATGVSTARPVIYFTGNSASAVTGIDDYLYYEKGVVVGDPVMPAPYVHHGPGTLTAEAVYDENIQISDYVFDQYFDKTGNSSENNYTYYSIDEMIRFMEENRHLPTMTGRAEWNAQGTAPVGQLATELWVTYETHALYIKELHDKISAMENIVSLALNPLVSAYIDEIKLIEADGNLSAEEKQIKINELLTLIDALKQE